MRRALYARYAQNRNALLDWNTQWLAAGTVDELRGTRFELESRTRLAAWRPTPVRPPEIRVAALPRIPDSEKDDPARLDRDLERVRAMVARHSPIVASHRAEADRYRALASRARSRSLPWIKFVDLAYEHRSDGTENGVSGQVAIEVPLGADRANERRYRRLVRRETSEARGRAAEQATEIDRALADLEAFEGQRDEWRRLLRLAERAEEIAERWWRARHARPRDVGALLDEAFVARSTVIEARERAGERAGEAACSLLALSGVEAAAWPRVEARRRP